MKNVLLSFFFLFNLCIVNAQWIELGTGANALEVNDATLTMVIDNSENVYITGEFKDPNTGYYYVEKFNGNAWSELGAGSNSLNANGIIETLVVDDSGNVYASGAFTDSSTMYIGNHYVAKWNGTNWSKLGTGSAALNANGDIYSVAIDDSGNIYAAGRFVDTNGYAYVAKWNGKNWSQVGTGNNALAPNDNIATIAIDKYGNIYAAGTFTDSNGYQYVAKWNGITWSELGTGNNGLNVNNSIGYIALDDSGNVYATGWFLDNMSTYYVAKWNGKSWSELGTGSNAIGGISPINSILTDKYANVYAAGYYFNRTGGYIYSVEQWNGARWSELGTGANSLNANNQIYSIAINDSGNIYAAGAFTNSNAEYYVAKYTQTSGTTAITNSTSSLALAAYPNPTTGNVTITSPEAGQVSVYNMLGELVTTQPVYLGNTTINLMAAPTGIYTVILTGQANVYTPVKIIKN